MCANCQQFCTKFPEDANTNVSHLAVNYLRFELTSSKISSKFIHSKIQQAMNNM